MPMYEYQCAGCGAVTERLSWGDDRAPLRCACGSEQLERVWYSRVAVASGGASVDAACAGPCQDGGGGGCCGGACAMD